jgi:hypothetical protein
VAYTSVARKIAVFPEYRQSLIRHLFEVKLFHWDIEVRKLSSKALYELIPLDTDFAIHVALPFLQERCTDENLFVRHGSVLGVAEIILPSDCK